MAAQSSEACLSDDQVRALAALGARVEGYYGAPQDTEWAIAGAVYVWPRITGSAIWSFKLGNWGFWLITLGISAMGLVLSAQGLQQGFMLMAQSEFLETVTAIRPYWWVRTFTGISMDLGISLVVYTLMKGSLARSA